MSRTPLQLEPLIRKYLLPLLKNDGFAGSGRTFRRIDHDAIHLVNVQGFSYGGRLAINLAVHPLDLPDMAGGPPSPKTIAVHQCEFRERLTEDDSGRLWEHDATSAGMDSVMCDAAAVYASHGRRFFDQFRGASSVLKTFDFDSFMVREPDLSRYCFGSWVRVAYVLARLRLAEGRVEEAKKFAHAALADATPQFAGFEELQRITNLAWQVD